MTKKTTPPRSPTYAQLSAELAAAAQVVAAAERVVDDWHTNGIALVESRVALREAVARYQAHKTKRQAGEG